MRLLLLLVFLFFAESLLAQQAKGITIDTVKSSVKHGVFHSGKESVENIESVKDSLKLQLDRSKNQVHEFDKEAIEKYKKEKEFQYGDEEPKGLNWWQRFWRNFWIWLDRLFGQRDTTSAPSVWPVVLKYGLIAIAIGVIIFAVVKLSGVDFKLFSGKSKEVAIPYDESLENIHEISFDDEITNTLQNGNYRLAVRLLYLQTLKHLSDREIIDWLPNKTNQAYVKEVQKEEGYQEFANLTNQFEYIWYGDFNIDKEAFGQIQQSFQQFNSIVK